MRGMVFLYESITHLAPSDHRGLIAADSPAERIAASRNHRTGFSLIQPAHTAGHNL